MSKIPDDELLDDLKRVADDLGESPSTAAYRKHGSYSRQTLKDRFGTWNDAKEAAELEITQQGEVPAEELIDDLQRVADDLGESPSMTAYQKHGSYSHSTLKRQFGTWNDAKEAAELEIIQLYEAPDEELIDDLQRVADDLGRSPTISEYNARGRWTRNAVYAAFGPWNQALDAAGLLPSNSHGVTDTDFLSHIRTRWESAETLCMGDFMNNSTEFCTHSCEERFGSSWRALVRAGVNPPVAPLSEPDYDQYIESAKNVENPYLSLIGLLRAFTGIPLPTIAYLGSDWVSRLDDNHQPPLLTVPSEYITAGEDWVMILPTHYTIAGDRKPTHLGPLFSWVQEFGELTQSKRRSIDEIITRAGLDVGPASLRASVATHLARRGVSRGEIEMQVGASKTDWHRSVADFYLYLYQFEDYCHPGYEPSGTYLNPETGDAYKPASEAD